MINSAVRRVASVERHTAGSCLARCYDRIEDEDHGRRRPRRTRVPHGSGSGPARKGQHRPACRPGEAPADNGKRTCAVSKGRPDDVPARPASASPGERNRRNVELLPMSGRTAWLTGRAAARCASTSNTVTVLIMRRLLHRAMPARIAVGMLLALLLVGRFAFGCEVALAATAPAVATTSSAMHDCGNRPNSPAPSSPKVVCAAACVAVIVDVIEPAAALEPNAAGASTEQGGLHGATLRPAVPPPRMA